MFRRRPESAAATIAVEVEGRHVLVPEGASAAAAERGHPPRRPGPVSPPGRPRPGGRGAARAKSGAGARGWPTDAGDSPAPWSVVAAGVSERVGARRTLWATGGMGRPAPIP